MGNFLNDLLSSASNVVQMLTPFTQSLWVYPIVFLFITVFFFLLFTSNK